MFAREHHQRIATLLRHFDGEFFEECEAWFAGGTAIALQLGEFRRSDEVDFRCASMDGYRRLRERVFEGGLKALSSGALPVLRDVRADQYGIRAVLGTSAAPIKFEIVREVRVALRGAGEDLEGVPLLGREDLYVEKLLANADRGLDRASLHRDLIDLCVMRQRWGPIPSAAWARARQAYGSAVDRAVTAVSAKVKDRATRRRCLAALDASPGVDAEIARSLRTGLGAQARSSRRR